MLTIGVVGSGMIARTMHIPNIVKNPRLKLKWFCDVDKDSLNQLAKQYNVGNITANYQEILDDPEVDLVLNAASHKLREKFIEAAGKAGKPVYVEKPLANSPTGIGKILRYAKEYNMKICVGHNRSSSPAIQETKRLLEKHRANPVRARWQLDRNSDLRDPIGEEEQTMIFIRVNDDLVSWEKWSFEEGMLLGEMTHFIDLACYFMDKRPIRVVTEGRNSCNLYIIITFEDGSLATLAHTGVGTYAYPKELIEITHKNSIIVMDHHLEVRQVGMDDEPFRKYFKPEADSTNIDAQGVELFYQATEAANKRRIETGDNEEKQFWPYKGHYDHLDRFLDTIEKDAPSPCDAKSAALATALTLKARQSALLGIPLRFGPDEDQIVILE